MKQRYLVVYDYGMGGLWAYVVASSPAQIVHRFPELTVFESKPEWMADDSPELDGIAVEDIDEPGAFLGSLLTARNVEHWQRVVEEIVESLHQDGEWARWIPPHVADGVTPIDVSGIPIFDARSRRTDRAFRIIEHTASGSEPAVAAWVETYEDGDYDRSVLPRDELFISLSLSEESTAVARELLTKWMTPETTVDGMRVFIDERT